MTVTRLLAESDAADLAALMSRNREHLAPWDPLRSEEFFTEAGQAKAIGDVLAAHAAGTALPLAILDADGALAGRVTLSGIVRGALLSGAVGYWVSHDRTGNGLASAALAEVIGFAFGELGLHRIQAETLLNNETSQRILARHGFVQYGLAPRYLKIAGRWQDCLMFQLLAHDRED